MKFFGIISVVGAIVFGALSVVAQDPNVIITGLDSITAESRDLRVNVVDKITNPINAASLGIKIGPTLLNIADTCRKITQEITVDPNTFPDDVAQDIVDALVAFVEVHQALLNAIIGKHGILAHIPGVGPPLAGILRTLEAVVDTFAFAIIALIPTQQNPAQEQLAHLDNTFSQAIAVYA
ncbi:hypothetical protein C8Q77DRAFT_1161784 [Trametes polyzona]|nr:hypothetical protein C8Q77DRAFT_1161784 [Trametes polyzona]